MSLPGISSSSAESLGQVPGVLPPLAEFMTTEEGRRWMTSSRLQALQSAPRPDDPVWNTQVADLLHRSGEPALALHHAEQAVDLANGDPDGDVLARALRALLVIQLNAGDTDRARVLIDRLHALARATRDPRMLACFSESRAVYLLRVGDLQSGAYYEAESQCRQAIRTYGILGDHEGRIQALDTLASTLSALGHYPAAIEVVDEAIAIVHEMRLWRFVPGLLMDRAYALRDLGFHDPAKQDFQVAIAWGDAIGDEPMLARALMGQAVLLGYDVTATELQGLEQVEETFRRALQTSRRTGAVALVVETHLWWAELLAKIGQDERAETLRATAASLAAECNLAGGRDSIERREASMRMIDADRQMRFQARIRAALDSIADAVFVLDPVRDQTGRVIDLINEFRNPPADRLGGVVTTDVRTLSQLIELPAFIGLRDAIWAALDKKENFRDELDLGADQGYARHVVPAGDGVAVTLRDITLDRAARRALLDAAERAREADHAKSEFLANMSHEVRTPINGVLGLARLLKTTELDEVQQTYVDGIISSTDLLLGVIGDVLDLSKIEAGGVEIEAVPTDLKRLVREVVGLFQGQAVERGLDLRTQLGDELPEAVLVDGGRLRQVLANLVGNAVKFTREGLVEIRVTAGEEKLHFEVADTGSGIPADQVDTIFEAFRQGGREARLQGGTGLGLTICRRIVELMGGHIGVVSIPSEGSMFWFDLPLVSAALPEEITPKSPRRFDGMRVLLVEDNPVNVMVASGLLRNLGCEVSVATDGAPAVEMVLREPFALVLMDVRMPGLDGLEATRRIRQAGVTLPIVALTASAFTDDREECFYAGMNDYLGKPFTPEALRTVIARWAPA